MRVATTDLEIQASQKVPQNIICILKARKPRRSRFRGKAVVGMGRGQDGLDGADSACWNRGDGSSL
jgi:hypothetical protein